MSADGGVVLYQGRLPDKEDTHHLLDGKTGAFLYSFPAKRYHPAGGSVSDDGRFVMLIRNDGFGIGHTVEILDIRGTLVASTKLPKGPGNSGTSVAVSWKGRAIVMHQRDNKTLTVYDLPDFVGAGVVVGSKPPDPKV